MDTERDLVKEAVKMTKENIFEATEGKFDGRAVLLFSGGRDSSAVAASFCRAFPDGQLYLLLIDNGLLSRLDNAVRQANLIKRLFKNTDIIFETRRVSEMMRRVGMQTIEKDFVKRNYSTLLICLTCKIIMSVTAARFARNIGTNLVLDGYANRQNNYPEQTIEFMKIIRDFYTETKIQYVSPLYKLLNDVDLVNDLLKRYEVIIPKQEPLCMWSDSFSTAKAADIEKYTKDKLKEVLKLDPILHL